MRVNLTEKNCDHVEGDLIEIPADTPVIQCECGMFYVCPPDDADFWYGKPCEWCGQILRKSS